MINVSYGSYVFPTPSPFFAVDDSAIYIKGSIDHLSKKISLVGTITGANLSGIYSTKQKMTNALMSGYQNLTLDSKTYTSVKPVSISFQDSNLTTILPYSVDFEAYESGSFSQYFGIKDPVDSWSYAEQDGRIINVVHTVSAAGVKVNQINPFNNAYNWVTGYSNQIENFSIFHSGTTDFILRSTTEDIDEFKGSYGLTKNYTFSTSSNPIKNNAIISTATQINYSKDSRLQVSINGTITGPLNGTAVDESYFTAEDAKRIASEALTKSKSNFEGSVYGFIAKGPVSSNYETNVTSNTINFSFQFKDPSDLRGDVLNNYTVQIAASKDSNKITATVNGELVYNGIGDLYTAGTTIENNPRFIKVNNFFNSIDPYQLALEHYSSFISLSNNIYETSSYLNPKENEQSIVKNPFENSITYSYSYSNNIDPSNGQLNNCEVSITNTKPIPSTVFKEGMNGLVNQLVANRMLGEYSVQAISQDVSGSLPTLKSIANQYLTKNCKITNETSSVSENTITYSISSLY